MRKRMNLVFALSLLGAMVLVLPAQAQVVHRVHVGGPDADLLGPGGNASFSLIALEFANGRVQGQWTDQFGHGEGGFHARIDCLFVNGNEAWVSGVITKGQLGDLDLAGEPVATRVVDNGVSQQDPPDQISFSWISDPTPCYYQVDYDLLAMSRGQVVVE